MNEKEIKALAEELSQSPKTPEDQNQLFTVLKKVSIEATLEIKLSVSIRVMAIHKFRDRLQFLY